MKSGGPSCRRSASTFDRESRIRTERCGCPNCCIRPGPRGSASLRPPAAAALRPRFADEKSRRRDRFGYLKYWKLRQFRDNYSSVICSKRAAIWGWYPGWSEEEWCPLQRGGRACPPLARSGPIEFSVWVTIGFTLGGVCVLARPGLSENERRGRSSCCTSVR